MAAQWAGYGFKYAQKAYRLAPPYATLGPAGAYLRPVFHFTGGVQTTYWSVMTSRSPCFSFWK